MFLIIPSLLPLLVYFCTAIPSLTINFLILALVNQNKALQAYFSTHGFFLPLYLAFRSQELPFDKYINEIWALK